MDDLKNVAGYGVGTLAALTTIKSGGLGAYLMNRQRMMSDPGFRATLAGSPFAAGVFGVSGATGPAPAAPGLPAAATGGVAQPADMVGLPPPGVPVAAPGQAAPGQLPAPSALNVPGYMPGTPRAWMPKLPPYDPEEALKQQALASTQIALGATDALTSGIAKTQAGIMPTQRESDAILGQAKDIQRTAGAGSTVGVKLPGMTVQIGSPYNFASVGPEEYPNYQAAAAAAAARNAQLPAGSAGWTVVPSGRGTFVLAPPPSAQQQLPATPPAPEFRGPGGAAQPGAQQSLPPPGPQANRIDPYHAAFTNAADVHGLPHGLLNAMAERESSFNPTAMGPKLPEGDQAIGLMQFRPATAQQYGVDPTDPMSSIGGAARYMRTLIDQNKGNVAAALQQYGGGPHYPVGDILARADQYRGAIDQAPAAPVQVAQAAPPAPAPAPAPARAAPPATPPPPRPVARPAPPTPAAGAPTWDPNATVPHVMVPMPEARVGYPPAAFGGETPPTVPVTTTTLPPGAGLEAAATPPPPMPPGRIPVEPTTGLPLSGKTVESQAGSQTYTAPNLGDVETQLRLNRAGITDPKLATPPQIANYFAQERAWGIQQKMDAADVERLRRGMSEGDAEGLRQLIDLRNQVNRFEEVYQTPEQRAQFVGPGTWQLQGLRRDIGWGDSRQIANFRSALAPFSFENLGAKDSPLKGDLAGLATSAPSGADSPDQFESNLQAFRDRIDDKIFQRTAFRGVPESEITPERVNGVLEAAQAARFAQRLKAFETAGEAPAVAPSPPPAPTSPAPPPGTAFAGPPPPAPAPWQPAWIH
jgi:soluble lytic murein transglycosylase-like protein